MPTDIAIIAGKPKEENGEPMFDLPKGVDMADVKEGDEKEVTAIIRNYGDGKACLVAINGVPLKRDDEDKEEQLSEEEPADDESMAPPSPQTMGGAAQMAGLM